MRIFDVQAPGRRENSAGRKHERRSAVGVCAWSRLVARASILSRGNRVEPMICLKMHRLVAVGGAPRRRTRLFAKLTVATFRVSVKNKNTSSLGFAFIQFRSIGEGHTSDAKPKKNHGSA